MPSARTWSEVRGRRAETGAVLLLAVWLSRPFITPGRYLLAFDTINYSIPNHVVTMDAWRHGRIPLWNDLIFGGVAHLGNAQTGALYLPRLLTWGLEPTRAINLLLAGHVVLLAVGMLAVARRLAMPPPAGFVVALVGVANGASMARSIQFEQFCVLAWVPLILVGIHACLTSTRPAGAIAGTGAAASMAVLAGHPQIVYMAGALAAAWALLIAARCQAWTRLWAVAAALAVAVATCAVQLAATLAATSSSAISGGRSLASLARPDLVVTAGRLPLILGGSMSAVDQAALAGTFEASGYIGVAAAGLVICALVGAWKERSERLLTTGLAICAATFVVLALGPSTILFRGAYHLVPGFDLARVSARWLTPATLCLAILAGFGVTRISPDSRRALLIGMGGLGAAIALAGSVQPSTREALIGWIVIVGVSATAIAVVTPARIPLVLVVLAAAVTIELGLASTHSFAQGSTSSRSATSGITPATRFLAEQAGWSLSFTDDVGDPSAVSGLRPNAQVIAGVRSIDGYDGGVQVTTLWLELIATVNPEPTFELPMRNQVPLPLESATAADLGIRYLVIDNRRNLADLITDWGEPVIADERFSFFENPAWIGSANIADRPFDLQRMSPEHLRVIVDGDGGMIEVDAQLQPGWIAMIDGDEVPVTSVDGFRMAAEVASGQHVVEFWYRPRWLLPSLLVSGLGVGLIVGGAVLSTRGNRRGPSTDSEPGALESVTAP